jgi:hypothetical protein
VIYLGARLKNHVQAFPFNVCGNNLHTTSLYSTFVKFQAIINCLTWYFGKTPSSRSYLGKRFFGCLGNGCKVPRMEKASIVRHEQFVAMFLAKLQFSQEDGIEVTRAFIIENAEWFM